MGTELDQVTVNHLPTNGINVQDVASLGAVLTSVGLTRLQVQGLISQMQKVALQTALNTIGEVLEDVRKVQEARMMEILNQVNAMPGVAGHINKNRVTQIVIGVMSSTPRQ